MCDYTAQKVISKVDVGLKLYFEVWDAAIFHGSGNVGYTSVVNDHTQNFSYLADQSRLTEMVEESRRGIAEFLKVQPEKVRLITREEFEAKTEDDEDAEGIEVP